MRHRLAASRVHVLSTVLGVAVLAGVVAPATSSTAVTAGARPVSDRPVLDGAAAGLVQAGQPGAVVLARRDRHVTAAALGLADKASARAMDVRDRVHVGSITKTFVSTVALQLVGEHRLGLAEPLTRLLPGALAGTGYRPATITLRDLLQHTSGIRDYLDDPRFQTLDGLGRRWTPRQLVDIATEQGPPLTGWNYANTNYVLVGMIVERVTGHSLPAEVRRRIIDPLRLADTSFPLTDTGIPGRHAHGYFTPYGDVTTAVNLSAAWAAGAMISTAPDVARFLGALMDGTLLRPAQLREMTRTIPVRDAGLFDERYGLGIYSVRLPCGIAWGHDGGYPGGFRSYAFTDRPGSRQGVVVDNDFGISDQPDNPTFRSAAQRAVTAAYCR